MTVEAALIIPFILGIFMLLIFTSLFLYNRSVLIQDSYIKCHRAATFTYWEDGYGEVTYSELARRSQSEARNYIEAQNNFSKYPFFILDNENILVLQPGVLTAEIYIQISLNGTVQSFMRPDYKININTVSSITNPVSNLRSARREEKRGKNNGN